MAEPVFEDGDPLGEYLKEAGDTMPGHSDPTSSQDVLWSALVSAFHACLSYLPTDTPLTHEHHASPFAERFKYDIISSSLLATTADFAPLRSGSSLGTPAFPGALGHSRGSSVSQDHQHRGPVEQGQGLVDRRAPRAPAQGHVDVRPLAALSLVLAILTGYHVLAVLTLLSGGALFLVLNSQTSHHPVAEQEPEARQEEDKTTPNMTALHELIVAGSIWDSIVHSTIALLESEESAPSTSFSSPFPSIPPTSMSPSFFHGNNSINGSTSPSKSPTKLSSRLSPASLALRGALQSALSMTHAHCDSVRALLSALTLPGELAQMAEMYAPPSPGPSRFLSARDSPSNLSHVFGGAPGVGRPVSFPGSKLTTPSRDRERRVKRATWDGHVAAPQNAAVASSPNVTVRKRRAGRRMGEMKSLDLGSPQADRSQGDEAKGDDETPFGPAALGLHRTRKLSGLSQLLAPAGFAPSTPPRQAAAAPVTPPSVSSAHAAPYTPYMPRTPFAGGNPAYGGRHHLSLGALHSALAGALASKRFACAHLLALRFDEEDASPPPPAPHSHSSRPHSRRRSRAPGSSQDGREDEEEKEREREAYWEDVRSVMGLLASTLSDTAASLVEALAEAEEQRRRDGNPTPTSEGYRSLPRSLLDPDASFSVLGGSDIGDDVFDSPKGTRTRLMLDVLNIDDQGEGEADGFAPAPSRLSRFAAHVGAIQAALDGAKEDLDDCVAAVRQSTAGSGAEAASSGEEDRNAEEEAMLAYERMRRELGLALRECERGREKLAELIATRASSTTDAEEEGDGVPELAEDSDRSDKHDSVGVHTRTPTVEFHTDPLIAAPDPHYPDDDEVVPPMGAELVYEAEPEPAVTFNRERSKLTREERIRVAKAKRDSGLGLLDNQETEQNDGSQEGEPWSHGVDVVQELKDVIWQVGERRRKQAEVEL